MVDVGVLRHIDGFETGGTNLAQAIQGAPSILGSIASPAGRSGAFALRCNPAATQEQYDTWGGWGSGGTPGDGAGNHYLVGAGVRFSDLAPGTEYAFMTMIDGAASITARLFIEADGDLRFEDIDSVLLTEAAPFTVDAFHYPEVAFGHINATNTPWEVWLDGVSLGTGNDDFFDVTGSLNTVRLGGAGAGDGNVDFDDIYIVGHSSTLQGNNLGPSEVFAYQGQAADATADFGTANLNITSGGSPLWSDAAQTPLTSSTWSGYDGSDTGGTYFDTDAISNAGHGKGPTGGAYTLDGIIQGAMWFGIYQRGTGGGTDHILLYGNDAETVLFITMDSIANNSDTFRAVVSESANAVPLSSETLAMGGQTTGAQDLEFREQWAFILHTPVVASDVFPLLPYKKPENVLLRR